MRLDLYNNPKTDTILEAIGLKRDDIPRLRGVGIDGDKILIHTRTGGGNRDHYENEETCRSNYPDYFKEGELVTGPWNDTLRANPYFLYDEDDDFDSTYANFWFKIPDEHKELEKLEDCKAKAMLGDAPTAIGLMFGDKNAIEQVKKNLETLKEQKLV